MKQLSRSSAIRVQLPLLSGQAGSVWKRWLRTCGLSEGTSYSLLAPLWDSLLDRWNQWNKYFTFWLLRFPPYLCYTARSCNSVWYVCMYCVSVCADLQLSVLPLHSLHRVGDLRASVHALVGLLNQRLHPLLALQPIGGVAQHVVKLPRPIRELRLRLLPVGLQTLDCIREKQTTTNKDTEHQKRTQI